MDIFYKIIALLGGLAMFLYGMRTMGDNLKRSSGGTMKAALEKVTNKPAIGFLFGMLVTCMIQSSTATIVLTVGLVGAGFMTFRQSIGIVLGANVGTAITAQIIRLMDVGAGSGSLLYFFKADNLAPLALTIGIILIMFVKGNRANNTGSILMGFGILFMGLIFMSQSVSTLGDEISGLLTAFEGNYILGFLSGVIVTGIIQSSSAVVGILQSMASSVGLRFCGVFAIIIGVNIGDCLTTFLVSRIGAKPNQIRTAAVHVIYNIFAATLIIVVLFILRMTGVLGDEFWNMSLDSGGVANIHGIFRVVPAVLLLPFSRVFAGIAEKIFPDKPMEEEDAEIENHLRELDYHLVSNPTLALDQSARLIEHMAEVAQHNVTAMCQQIENYDEKRFDRIHKREELLDRMADAANRYIVEMSPYITEDDDSMEQGFQMRAVSSFERIGDHAVNVNYDLVRMRENKQEFSEASLKELQVVNDAINSILQVTVDSYKRGDAELSKKVEPLEEVIDELIEAVKNRHIIRLTHNSCDIYSGIQYENILTNLERISDMCSDIALIVLGRNDRSIVGKEHQYIHNLHHSNEQGYMEAFEAQHKYYFSRMPEFVLETESAEPEDALPVTAE